MLNSFVWYIISVVVACTVQRRGESKRLRASALALKDLWPLEWFVVAALIKKARLPRQFYSREL